ncbi:MAG: hypothetical protein ACYDD1_02385 [Caulobacteraceae bacterium]
MIEHLPWVGSGFAAGLNGEKVAIVGYSHWKNEGESDRENMTQDVVARVVSGEYAAIRFFSDISRYFGYAESPDFWRQVLFFNFVPDVIGNGDQRFAYATPEQTARGAERAKRIYAQHGIDRAFVFTTRGWNDHPALREEEVTRKSQLPDGTRFTWGTYEGGGHVTKAFGLRHPQGAPGEAMREAVRLARAA